MTMNSGSPIYEFGDFRLDAKEKRLTRTSGEDVSLPPKAFDLLQFLVANPGRLLEKNAILDSVWAGSFVEEGNLKINIHLLRKTLGDGLIETVPRRGYRFVAPVEGIEKTEILLERETEDTITIERIESPKTRSKHLLAAVLLVAVVVSAGGIYFATRNPEPEGRRQIAEPDANSIAVVPFTNITKLDDDDALAVGIAETLISRLSEISRISVRTSSASDPKSGSFAAHILEGSIQRADGRIRVTYKLLKSSDRSVLLAETVDVSPDKLLDLQDKIVGRVVETMAGSIGASDSSLIAKRETASEESFQLYLRGNYLLSKRDKTAVVDSIDAFRRSIAADQQFSLPYIGVARAYMVLGDSALGEMTPIEAAEKARPELDTALRLNPNSAEATAMLGTLQLNHDWNIEKAEETLKRAIAINPHISAARLQLAWLHIAKNEYDAAEEQFRAAIRIEPASTILATELAHARFFQRDYATAEAQFRSAVDFDNRAIPARFNHWRVLHQMGRNEEAVGELDELQKMIPADYPLLLKCRARTLHKLGRVEEAETLYARLAENTAFSPMFMAILAADLGKNDDAFKYLNTSLDQRNDYLLHLSHAPEFDGLRNDPRYSELQNRVLAARK